MALVVFFFGGGLKGWSGAKCLFEIFRNVLVNKHVGGLLGVVVFFLIFGLRKNVLVKQILGGTWRFLGLMDLLVHHS